MESAIKIVRVGTGRLGVIAAQGAWRSARWGRSCPASGPAGRRDNSRLVTAIAFLFKADIDPKCVAVIIFAPIQADSGF